MAELPKSSSQGDPPPGGPRTLVVVSLVIFIFSLAFYFVIAGYEKVIGNQSKSLDKEIQDTAVSLSPGEIQKLLLLDSQIKSLKVLLPQHTYLSRTLDYLEANTLPQIKISTFSADARTHRIGIQGFAPEAQTASLQAAAFENASGTQSFAIKNVGASRNGTAFIFEILFDPSLILPH